MIEKIRIICQLYIDKPLGYELGIKSALYYIFFQLFLANQVVKEDLLGSKHEIERFKKVFEYIRQNFSQRISIEELARISHLSKYHFIRMFKRMTGRTPLDYLNHYRMQQAAKLLEADKLKIVDIACEVGIDDSSYFTKLFQKYFTVCPSQYRLQ